jgi:hypothetical protein
MRRVMLAVVVLTALVGAAGLAWAQAPTQIQAVQDFLLGWGKGTWEGVTGKATVKVGGKEYAIDPEAKKADVALVLPFKGLTTVRDKGKVTGVTVESITVKAGGEEKKGKATVSLEEKDGKFTVTGISVE